MEKQNKVRRIYGYAVAIIAIIVFIINIASLIYALLDLSDPLHAGREPSDTSLVSFESYKLDALKGLREDVQVPDDQTLRAMYEAAKNDVIQSVQFHSKRSMTVSGLLIVISIILFTTHLIWMRKLAKVET